MKDLKSFGLVSIFLVAALLIFFSATEGEASRAKAKRRTVSTVNHFISYPGVDPVNRERRIKVDFLGNVICSRNTDSFIHRSVMLMGGVSHDGNVRAINLDLHGNLLVSEIDGGIFPIICDFHGTCKRADLTQ